MQRRRRCTMLASWTCSSEPRKRRPPRLPRAPPTTCGWRGRGRRWMRRGCTTTAGARSPLRVRPSPNPMCLAYFEPHHPAPETTSAQTIFLSLGVCFPVSWSLSLPHQQCLHSFLVRWSASAADGGCKSSCFQSYQEAVDVVLPRCATQPAEVHAVTVCLRICSCGGLGLRRVTRPHTRSGSGVRRPPGWPHPPARRPGSGARIPGDMPAQYRRPEAATIE